MFKTIKQLRALVAEANAIATQDTGGKPRWSLFFTNRSFVAGVLAAAILVANIAGVPVPAFVGPELADIVVEATVGLLGLWALAERVLGHTRVIWNRKQAQAAVTEADALSTALRDALKGAK